MISGNDKFERHPQNQPHLRGFMCARPHWTRRQFFRMAGGGITGAFLAERGYADGIATTNPATINRARSVLFILLAGAASPIDTFDLKQVDGVTPSDFAPETINGIRWPAGLLPKIGGVLGDIAIVRSMRAWALVHNLAQTWAQIGRNPAAALGDIAPNIGSIVALEKEKERTPAQAFPTFLALNSNGAVGSGYLPATYAPFKVIPAAAGLANTTNPDGAVRLEDRWNLLHSLDDPLRVDSPYGKPLEDMDEFYKAAKGMTYNPVVDQAFKFTSTDSARYGGSAFGNALLVARQVLAANQGTRFIQVTLGGWDMHQNIYDRQANPRGNIYALGKTLDDGFTELVKDLKASGLLNETLVVMMGEFGRTVGRLSGQNGRDHYPHQFCVFAGAGVKGGRTIGSTNDTGAATREYGWSRDRDVRPEDVEATIYSAMGINWKYVNYNDPFGRGYEYVPGGKDDLYGPIDDLWS
ncbi:MAG: DUF1501 domain-containing protein [Acidobacteria bacterium]|nr:DUF1501 domain-containing protein [Acidobacteriota bacterium]